MRRGRFTGGQGARPQRVALIARLVMLEIGTLSMQVLLISRGFPFGPSKKGFLSLRP